VTLLLYGDDPAAPVLTYRFDYLTNKSGRIWHCRIPKDAANGARYYGYRVDGRSTRSGSNRFDPQKVLLDPYATAVYFPPAFDREAAIQPGDNAGRAPLAFLCACEHEFDWQGDRRIRHEADAIIYELHVGGFTRNPNSGVAESTRGTFAGVIGKIPYLRELGITAVELMPVFQQDPGEGSHWGYMPLSFFAPHHGYATSPARCSQLTDFAEMVRALHEAGIEVILDVVYNHTAEGDHQGPVYCFKGIDNDTYYLMSDAPAAPYANFSGTGNTLNCSDRLVRKMVLDSLRVWVEELHVDGFRFDLASIFTRNTDGSINLTDPLLLADITADAALAGTRLIAEPWDAAGTYQLGRSFPGILWLQWNGKFRDDVRRFVRGDRGLVGAIMRRLYGSDDLFPDDRASAYHAYQSVNFVTSHDGFTLYDLVAYNEKHNWANGHANADGPADNYSWNCGWEGDRDVPDTVMELRKRQVKNFCCLLFIANGTPMFRAGDEFLQTQHGNNNPYNQDNETTWLDWSRLEAHRDIFRFFKLAIAFRKAHPSLSRSRFWRDDVRWYGVGARTDPAHDSHSVAFSLHGASEHDQDLYVMINAYWESLVFTIQEGASSEWKRVIDTSAPSPDDFYEARAETPVRSLQYRVQPRSIVVLIRHTADERRYEPT
jgi:glycogen operon protein